MPADSETGDAVSLPHTWRPLGVRLAGGALGGALLILVVGRLARRSRPRSRTPFTPLPASHRDLPGAAGGRDVVRAAALPRGRHARAPHRGQRLQAPRLRVGAGRRDPHAARRTVGDPRPRRRRHRRGDGHPGLGRRPVAARAAPGARAASSSAPDASTRRSAASAVPCAAKCACSSSIHRSQWSRAASPSRASPRSSRRSASAATQTRVARYAASSREPEPTPSRTSRSDGSTACSSANARRVPVVAPVEPGQPGGQRREDLVADPGRGVAEPLPALVVVVHVQHPGAGGVGDAAARVVLPEPAGPSMQTSRPSPSSGGWAAACARTAATVASGRHRAQPRRDRCRGTSARSRRSRPRPAGARPGSARTARRTWRAGTTRCRRPGGWPRPVR